MPVAKTLISSGLRRTGLAATVRRIVAKRRVSILLYHDPSTDTIARHLEYLRPRYNGIALSRVVDAMKTGDWETLPEYPLVITFDDGWRGNQAVAELCREAGFPITIYACSQIVGTGRHYWWTEAGQDDGPLKRLGTEERLAELAKRGFTASREYGARQALSLEELAAMVDYVEFGGHTRFHPILTACTDDHAWDEIAGSRRELEAMLGQPCRHFAFPNGDYTEREIEMVKRAGFGSARTVDVGWNTASTDVYRLKALPTIDDASVNRLAADLSGAGFLWRWKWTGKWDGRHPTIRIDRGVNVRAGTVRMRDTSAVPQRQ